MAIPRQDGEFSFYAIQHLWIGKEDIERNWVFSTENERYFTGAELCWQETGNSGTYDLRKALLAIEKAASRDEHNRKFRLVQILTTRKTVVI